MLDIRKILVPRDFSACSNRALREGIVLARRYGAALHVLHAEVLYGEPYAPYVVEAPGTGLEAALVDDIGALDLAVVPAVVRDVAAPAGIVAYARQHNIDLIVMGTHGRRGLRRMLLGSTAEEVVRTAPCPVFTVSRDADANPLQGPFLVPVDFSEHSRLALRHARALAAEAGARLHLLHVVEDQLHPAFYDFAVHSIYDLDPDIDQKALAELETFFHETEGPAVEVAFDVRHGAAAREIAAFAEAVPATLVVLATHGLRGLDHVLMGSVAEKVVRTAPCPVFTVKSFGKALVGAPEGQTETAIA